MTTNEGFGTVLRKRSLWLVIAIACLISLQVAAAGIDIAEFVQADAVSLTNTIELIGVACGVFTGWLLRL